jgi:hypothetical protein
MGKQKNMDATSVPRRWAFDWPSGRPAAAEKHQKHPKQPWKGLGASGEDRGLCWFEHSGSAEQALEAKAAPRLRTRSPPGTDPARLNGGQPESMTLKSQSSS